MRGSPISGPKLGWINGGPPCAKNVTSRREESLSDPDKGQLKANVGDMSHLETLHKYVTLSGIKV